MKLFTFLFLVIFSPTQPQKNSNEMPHKFHFSKCIVEYSQDEEALQIMLHIFIDDLERRFQDKGLGKLFLCTDKEVPNAEDQLFKYLQEKFKIEVNQENNSYIFVGKEASEDLQAVWCYLEIPNLKSIKQLSIRNDLLMEIFNDQKNIININLSSNKKAYFLFEKGNSFKSIEF